MHWSNDRIGLGRRKERPLEDDKHKKFTLARHYLADLDRRADDSESLRTRRQIRAQSQFFVDDFLSLIWFMFNNERFAITKIQNIS